MKWLKRLALAIAILLLVVAASLWWLLATSAGLRFALARAQAATHGALQWQQAQGALIGPLQMTRVRYDDGHGTVVDVASARFDLRFWPLLAGRVHVRDLDVEGVRVALPKSSASTESSGSFSLKPPLDLLLDRAHVGSVRVTQAGQPLFASDSLDLAGRWTHAGIAIDTLKLRAPDGYADLVGRLAFARRDHGNGKADFAWTVGATRYAGRLVAHGDGKQAQLDLALTAPMTARLQVALTQSRNDDWTATLTAPRFDPKPLLGDSALTSVALDLRGHGDRRNVELSGALDLNQYRLQLQPLRAQLDAGGNTLTLQQFALTSPQIKGSLDADGTLQLDAKPLAGKLAIRWRDLQLPADVVGQPLASAGTLQAQGSASRFHATGDIAIGPPGKPTHLTLDVDGTPQAIVLHSLAVQQAPGKLLAQGTLQLQPALGWKLDASASRFDPGQLFAGWNGALDGALTSTGTLTKTGPNITLDIKQLAGKLRDRSVAGNAKLHLSPNRVLDGQLRLASGGSTVQLDAKPGRSNDANLTLAIASLGDWLPDASGHLDGQFRIAGMLPKLSINGQLHGSALVWQQQQVGTLQLIAGIPDIGHPAGKVELTAGDARLGGLQFQRLHLLAEGSQGDHRLELEAQGTPVSATLALHGALKNDVWSGTLTTLGIAPQGMPAWRLQQPSRLGWRSGVFTLTDTCLTAGDPLLCIGGKRTADGALALDYRLHALPLALVLNALGEADSLRADGVLQGAGKLSRSARGVLSGHATISSDRGSLTLTEHAETPLLAYSGLALDADFGGNVQHLNVRAALDHGGQLNGQISMTGAQQALGGQLDVRLGDLGFLTLLEDSLANVHGSALASFRFGGTLNDPTINGQATVNDFIAEIPAAGLKLTQGRMTATSLDPRSLRVDGNVRSGAGTLDVTGVVGLGGDIATNIAIVGKQFTAADIPAAKVTISPDLRLERNAKGLTLGGSVLLDNANVDLDKLPGGGASKASPDVVVVDRPQPEASAALPFTAKVKVDLGEHTRLAGMGVDGKLAGTLTVSEQPGRAATGQGQITVSGSYHAYGQNLHIQRGQLLFAGTPLDNPGLDIRAVRKLNPNATIDEGQEVGLAITGTAQHPVLNVFSNPTMEQSDALAYLVTGKPLSQVSSGEGSMLGAAAQALGSAAGNLLAKSIGAKIGLDDIGVSSNEALNGNSAFTVGKYLSPRLYLSYGVGLFEPGQVVTLRYRLSHRWNFEAQSATNFNRASFNYRLEK